MKFIMKSFIKNNIQKILVFMFVCFTTIFDANAQMFVANNTSVYVDGTGFYCAGDINLETETSTIYLRNEAQLIQSSESNSNKGLGKISVYQEGTTHQFAYNYWCSPVGNNSVNTTSNNPFRVNQIHDPLLNTPNPIDSQYAQFTGGYNGSSNPLTIAKPWLYTFSAVATAVTWNFVGDTGIIAPGLGFTMKGTSGSNNNQAYDFRGKPNTGNISNTVLASQWTLIGNPYPSALDAAAFIHDTDNVNAISGTLYFWEQDLSVASHTTSDYVGGYAAYTISADGAVETFTPAPFNTYNQDGSINVSGNPNNNISGKLVKRYLPIGQGFLVQGKIGTSGIVTAKNAHRTYYKESGSESEFFRTNATYSNTNTSLPTDYKRFRLNLDFNDTYTRQLLPTFHSDATTGFDYGLENKCLNILNTDAYWETNAIFYTSQALSFDPQIGIPLTLKLSANTTVRFRLFDVQNFDANQSIYLFDSVTGIYYNLTDSNTELTLVAGIYTNRFEIRFYNNTLSADEIETKKDLWLYYQKSNAQIIINNISNLVIEKVDLYDLTGKIVLSKEINADTKQITIPVSNVATGVYICNIKSVTKEKISEKIIIN